MRGWNLHQEEVSERGSIPGTTHGVSGVPTQPCPTRTGTGRRCGGEAGSDPAPGTYGHCPFRQSSQPWSALVGPWLQVGGGGMPMKNGQQFWVFLTNFAHTVATFGRF